MNIKFKIDKKLIDRFGSFFARVKETWLIVLAAVVAFAATMFSLKNDWIVAYGDAESHLNIAKRVIDSLTPGAAQLGGIWLPLPHLMMVPFVFFNSLWRSGLAGSIVSGFCFVIGALFIYKTVFYLTGSKPAALVAYLVFIFNPNMLYMQSTPMTELPLILFFILSSYYFLRFLKNRDNLLMLILASFFGLCASASRYDGWFLVGFEGLVIALVYWPWKKNWAELEGKAVMFATVSFFGIFLWLIWDQLILGNAFYFINSQFSAKTQQQSWLLKGELPSYHNIISAVSYYLATAMANCGVIIFAVFLIGLIFFLKDRKDRVYHWLAAIVLLVPFTFNIFTLFMGQSVIFIPSLTPVGFEWRLFNVRYGLLALPVISIVFGYLFSRLKTVGRIILVTLVFVQLVMFVVGYSQPVSLNDGLVGLSNAKRPDAEYWMKKHYDHGLVLIDDYARTLSIIRSGIPMENIIYIGNKPYWNESLKEPEKYARWIIMQKEDSVWKALYDDPAEQARLYKYFRKVYTSPEILIFEQPDVNEVAQFNQTKYWPVEAIDTVKVSRDGALNPQVTAEIPSMVKKIAELHPNYIAIDTPYDEQFLPTMFAWINAARANNLKVWFRGNLSGWEGWFGYPLLTDVSQHHLGIANFIRLHPTIFQDGDIFTPAPEPENGLIHDPRSADGNPVRYNQFLVDSYNNCVTAFKKIGKKVVCGYFSVNGDIAKQILTEETVQKTGDRVVIDHYVKDPKQLAADILYLNQKLKAPIVLGEIGAPIPDIHGNMTDQQQADYMNTAFNTVAKLGNVVEGVDYWTAFYGSTALFDDNQFPKKVTETISKFYQPSILYGTVTDAFGRPIAGVTVDIQNIGLTYTDNIGAYSLLTTGDNLVVTASKPGYQPVDVTMRVLAQTKVAHSFTLNSKSNSFIYFFENILNRILMLFRNHKI